jgi:hypothetical protein
VRFFLPNSVCFALRTLRLAEYVQRYANPNRAPSSKASDDGSDKMDEDGRGAAGEEDDSDDGFLSSSEEEEQ